MLASDNNRIILTNKNTGIIVQDLDNASITNLDSSSDGLTDSSETKHDPAEMVANIESLAQREAKLQKEKDKTNKLFLADVFGWPTQSTKMDGLYPAE